jgi:dephospho-CoA kinase
MGGSDEDQTKSRKTTPAALNNHQAFGSSKLCLAGGCHGKSGCLGSRGAGGCNTVLRVGLTGGIATGKTTVSQLFVQCGAHLIDADVLARKAVAPGQPALREIVASFGPGMLAANGTLNRDRVADIVFKDLRQRARLEAIIHPYVFAQEERRCQEIVAKDPHAVVIFDAALLIETGAYKNKDRVIVVTADEPTQLSRLMSRNNLTDAQARERIGAQMPLSEKIKVADYVIDGTLPIEQLAEEATRIYRLLKQLA